MLYGNPPKICGTFSTPTKEMMFWMYCPVSTPGSPKLHLPENLEPFIPFLDQVRHLDGDLFEDRWVYLTAKRLHVTPSSMGNRPGWHSDGFGTDDVNYIWCDAVPTVFLETDDLFSLPEDHLESMKRMEHKSHSGDVFLTRYPVGSLLRLDPSVIHKVDSDNTYEGMRTFVKITLSKDKFNLEGNSINHKLPSQPWVYHPRETTRNLECSK